MFKKSAKIILFDAAGVALIILGGLLAPIPGPWSIPLAILGLSLLAKNHHWAKRIFEYFREKTDELIPQKYVKPLIVLVILLFILISAVSIVTYYSFR